MSVRFKFLLALLLSLAVLVAANLVVVRRVVTQHVRRQILVDLDNSVSTFQNAEREREDNLAHSAELMADLPIVKALISTRDPKTIQDGSRELFNTSRSNLLLLTDASGQVMGFHGSAAVAGNELEQSLPKSVAFTEPVQWYCDGTRLFSIAIRPIYVGDPRSGRVAGYIGLGLEVDDKVAHELSQVAASDVVFRCGDTLVRSTLPSAQLRGLNQEQFRSSANTNAEIKLGNETFMAKELELSAAPRRVDLAVLKSLNDGRVFVRETDRRLLELGIIGSLLGALVIWIVSRTVTRPLESLVKGVRALAESDFDYPVESRCGADEVGELATAFRRMRADLKTSQRKVLESERLATIGRMASSISHDLRHHLVAVVSNAEFLADSRRATSNRDELYEEIRVAVHQMNDLLDSLLEFSRTRESLRRVPGRIEDAINAAIRLIRLRPEFRDIAIDANVQGRTLEGLFDLKRLERAFHNLLLNACEAVCRRSGKVSVIAAEDHGWVHVKVIDNGRGIPEAIQQQIFEPFFTDSKASGTGLGLTAAQKIVQDHGGTLTLESSSSEGSVFLVRLPVQSASLERVGEQVSSV